MCQEERMSRPKIARQLYIYQAQSKSAMHSKIYKVKASELRRIHRERVSLELLNIQPLNPFENCPIDSSHTLNTVCSVTIMYALQTFDLRLASIVNHFCCFRNPVKEIREIIHYDP